MLVLFPDCTVPFSDHVSNTVPFPDRTSLVLAVSLLCLCLWYLCLALESENLESGHLELKSAYLELKSECLELENLDSVCLESEHMECLNFVTLLSTVWALAPVDTGRGGSRGGVQSLSVCL